VDSPQTIAPLKMGSPSGSQMRIVDLIVIGARPQHRAIEQLLCSTFRLELLSHCYRTILLR